MSTTRSILNTTPRMLAIATLAIAGASSLLAQAPAGDLGMGPHRPPMERALGPMGLNGPEHGRWWNTPQAAEKYKLTDSQRKNMDDIFQKHRVTLVDLHATLEKAELAMEPMISADQPDESRILAQIDVVAQARAELEKANARMLLELRRQLTPEQWKQMEADRAARHAGPPGANSTPGARWHGPGHGGQNPPPPPGAPGQSD